MEHHVLELVLGYCKRKLVILGYSRKKLVLGHAMAIRRKPDLGHAKKKLTLEHARKRPLV